MVIWELERDYLHLHTQYYLEQDGCFPEDGEETGKPVRKTTATEPAVDVSTIQEKLLHASREIADSSESVVSRKVYSFPAPGS